MSVFVDSDVFVALAKEDDANHQQALAILNQLQQDEGVTFSTSNYVFAETVTVVSQRLSHAAAIRFIEEMTSAESLFIILRHTPQTENLALEIFKAQTSKNVGFVDCTNIALMRSQQLDAIFSFDDAYRRNGLTVLSQRYATGDDGV